MNVIKTSFKHGFTEKTQKAQLQNNVRKYERKQVHKGTNTDNGNNIKDGMDGDKKDDLMETKAQCLRVHASIAMALSECLELGEHLDWSPVNIKVAKCREEHRMTTWLPKHRLMCKLSLLPSKRTVIEIDGTSMYANPSFSLRRACPEGVVFYCTYTEDLVQQQDGTKRIEPRLLVYDAKFPSPETVVPNMRYETLRLRLQQYLPSERTIIQWAGYKECAYKVFSMKNDIGHEIEGLVCLGEKPGDLLKQIQVAIPSTFTMPLEVAP